MPRRPTARALLVFARAPELGRVKTRLAAGVGAARALAAYRYLAERTVAAAARVPACAVAVCHAPADAGDTMRSWLGADVVVRPQCEGDLGGRMAAAVADAFAAGAERAVVVGTDCPALDAAGMEAAFAALDAADVVLGPADDGGYYLVGLARPCPALFAEIPWSTPDTLRATRAAAAAAGLRVALLPPLADVDTADDWARWLATLPPDERAAAEAATA